MENKNKSKYFIRRQVEEIKFSYEHKAENIFDVVLIVAGMQN